MPNKRQNIEPRPFRWKGERDEDGTPIVPARRVVVERSENDSLIIECPYCGETHTHGSNGKVFGEGDGPRGSHCLSQVVHPDYILKEVATQPKRRAEPRQEVA